MECHDAEDEQEIALGMDTSCLVVDPGQATAYGGVRECELTERRLRLVLSAERRSCAAATSVTDMLRHGPDGEGTARPAAGRDRADLLD